MSYVISDADVLIDLNKQILTLPKYDKFYQISSGEKGIGEAENSGRTPRGWHKIAEKHGAGQPQNTVFIARQPTGEIYDTHLAEQFPERDWILSRILWLKGLEEGFNSGIGCDSYGRYIYIHGTPDTEPMGLAKSHGCIRMRNTDVMELFELIDCNALVYISASDCQP